MRLTFLGASETVTGSKFLLETRDKRFLIDCGLFQGQKELRERNWQALPFDPVELDALLHGVEIGLLEHFAEVAVTLARALELLDHVIDAALPDIARRRHHDIRLRGAGARVPTMPPQPMMPT